MLFSFLKYLQPTHYFTLSNRKGEYIYPIASEIPKNIIKYLNIDTNYSSKTAINYDLSFQAIEKGFVGDVKKIEFIEEIPIVDEYRFVKKYFSIFWFVYTFIIRLMTFNNPFKEINGFIKSFSVTKSNISVNPINYQEWNVFESKLLKTKPKVSVIIPTLNRYEYLRDVLNDLENQDYQNFDVIVMDQSEPYQDKFYDAFDLDIKLENQKEKALWLARNKAVELSDADYLLLFDDDSRVDVNWISNHLKCLDFFNADISSGVSISTVGAKIPHNYTYFKHSNQLDTGNVLIKRKVFKAIGLFDRQYEKQRMGDGEYGLRAYLYGFVNISNPYSKRLHLKVGSGGLRQMGSWDGFRPKKWFSPRPIPSVVYQFRKYYGTKMTIYSLIRSVPPSILAYKYKGNKNLILLAYLSLFLIWPLILIQVMQSWNKASLKLKQGALIKIIRS
jgi:glycosyltransferase involved in cell wall biosynthesis